MSGIKLDPDVKMENDINSTPSGSGYMDDDFYEDTGELQLPVKGGEEPMLLTRIPPWLWEKISTLEDLDDGNDDDIIQLGDIIAFPDATQNDGINKTKPMRLFFNDRWAGKSGLPTAYELQPQLKREEDLKNTYIFSEKDLPGYKPSGLGLGQNKGAQGSASASAISDPKARIQKRGKYRKAIPKQTALLGNPTHHFKATALNTREYMMFEAARNRQAILGNNSKTNIVEGHFNEMDTMDKNQTRFNSFIRTEKKKSNQHNKATRMAPNDLIDMLHTMFDQYKYWPMKVIKAYTKQPEAYLKEILADIAFLPKSGHFASHWTRNSMYEENRGASRNDGAPPDDMAGDDDDEDEDEMEDVV
jgi:transcription initiation factor TFIIF subunit beta